VNSQACRRERGALQQVIRKPCGSNLHRVSISREWERGYLHFLSNSAVCENQRVIASGGNAFPGSKERPPNQSRSISSLGRVRTIVTS